jgi:hypothetical protein
MGIVSFGDISVWELYDLGIFQFGNSNLGIFSI